MDSNVQDVQAVVANFSTKMDVFSTVKPLWLVFLEPLRVKRRYVSHFKGLISAKVELEAQGSDSTFTICLALLKKAILHHTVAAVPSQLATTVWPQSLHKLGNKQVFPHAIK